MSPEGEASQPPVLATADVLEQAQIKSSAVRRRNVRAAVASVVLVLAFGWVLSRGGFPLWPPAGFWSTVDATFYAAFCFGMVFNMLTRFARNHFLIAPLAKVPFRRIMTINAIGMALITYLPLRLGEMARPAMLRDKGLSAWAVTGTVGAERILDGLVFSGMLLVGLALASPQSPLPDHVGNLPVPVWLVPQSAKFASLVFAAAFLVMVAFYAFRGTARKLTERVVGVVSVPLARKLAGIVERMSDGLRFLTNWRYSLPYLAATLVSVMSLVWAVQMLAQAVGLPELSFSRSLVVLGVLALGFSAPNAPGFFGVVQLALYAGLATYIAPEKVAREGAVFVFLFYVTYLANVSLLAAIALLVELLGASAPTVDGPAGAGTA